MAEEIEISAAQERDSGALFDIYRSEYSRNSRLDLGTDVPAIFGHLIRHAFTVKATIENRPIGFGSAVVRGGRSFISMMYVKPDFAAGLYPNYQRRGIGRRIYEILAQGNPGGVFTLSSVDNRALGMYHRSGLYAHGVLLELRGTPSLLSLPRVDHIEAFESRSWQDVHKLDTEIFGADRAVDLAYWIEDLGSSVLKIGRNGAVVGYAFIVWTSDTDVWCPEAVTIGPVGVKYREDLLSVIYHAVSVALTANRPIRLLLHANNHILASLLHSGFKVEGLEVLCQEAECVLPDFDRYAPSNFATF